MATKTTNYNLIKPELTDDADIRVINGNMDVLDNQLKSISDKAGSATNNAYTNLTVSSDYTWKFTKGSGANASYDTIKKATTATAMSGTTSTYKVPTDASKYSQLEYWFGTMPYKGSTTATTDSGVLKFNHWGASNWNSAFVPNNGPSRRPYMMYQNGTAGEYSVFKELAWYDDTTNKLPLAGGTMTGAIKTTDNIYKTSNNGALVLSGSTDATHGGRINLSGEKQTDAGAVKITADNGTVSNVFEVTTGGGGSRYNFNGLTTYMNSNDDYFRFGGNDAYLRLSKNKKLISNVSNARFNNVDLYCNTNTDYFYFGVPNHYIAFNKDNELYVNRGTGNHRIASYKNNLTFIGNQDLTATHSGYVKFDDNLLIQWGYVNSEGSSVWNQTVNLPLPYANRGYVSMTTLTFRDNNHTINYDNRDLVYNQSESAIGVWSDTNNVVYWMTIGQGA